jgi:SRSO17 transposase
MGTASLAEMRATEPRERLEVFVRGVAAALPLARQRQNALVYARGLIEHGGRKSLQPTLFRLGATGAQYESLQQFLADSPWDPEAVFRACAERIVPQIAPLAWVIDDTGFPKDGRHSPGVMRQYSGTLGKVANCQIGVSLHAVGFAGTLPLGFALYLPEEWTAEPERRRRAKIPERVAFQTKPELACDLIERAAGWHIPAAPVIADQAYGDNAELRTRLDGAGIGYVLAIGERTGLFGPDTVFAVRPRHGATGRRPSVAHPDRPHTSALDLARGLPAEAFRRIDFATGPGGHELRGRFALVRVTAAHPVERLHLPPRQEWLIVEWPEEAERPSDLWLSNLPADTEPERLVQLARLRWVVELDYRQLKGELGLDHYEGRSYLGWHHHCALVTLAHAFLTEERLCPQARRPA